MISFSAVTYFASLCLAAGVYVYMSSGDAASCVVEGSGSHALDGYYAAFDGAYHKLGGHVVNGDVPSYYDYIDIHGTQSMPARELRFEGTEWSLWGLIASSSDPGASSNWRRVAYVRPEHPERYIHYPPETGWVAVVPSADGMQQVQQAPASVLCSGELDDSPSTRVPNGDNIAKLTSRPVTTALLLVNTAVAYLLWSYKVDVASVSFSYDAVARGEVWRLITASFAHFDLMHIGFNMMALYQLGDLEYEFGSIRFLYLNLDLVLLTMGVCVLIAHLRIIKFNHLDVRFQQAVGFSCVLFAWMTVASVRMNEYCPLFFYPSLCFETYHIGLPAASSNFPSLPVNLGPFVLLLVTKVILPRSSFVGHLSGILIGFPLAWNMLDWITVPVLAAVLVLAYLLTNHLWVGSLPGFESAVTIAALRDFIPSSQLRQLVAFRALVVVYVLTSLACLYSFGYVDIIAYIRVSCAALCVVCDHAVRSLWLSDLRNVKRSCVYMLLSAMFLLSVLFISDMTTSITLVVGRDLLIHSCDLPRQKLLAGTGTLLATVIAQLLLLRTLLVILHLTTDVAVLLKPLLLDEERVVYDMRFVSRTVRSIQHRLGACYHRLCAARRGSSEYYDYDSSSSGSSAYTSTYSNTSTVPFSGASYQLRDASLRSRTPPRPPSSSTSSSASGGMHCAALQDDVETGEQEEEEYHHSSTNSSSASSSGSGSGTKADIDIEGSSTSTSSVRQQFASILESVANSTTSAINDISTSTCNSGNSSNSSSRGSYSLLRPTDEEQ